MFIHCSVTANVYKGQQVPDSDRLARTAVGRKELTGYSENNDSFVHTADNPARFVTHYSTKYVLDDNDRKSHMMLPVHKIREL